MPGREGQQLGNYHLVRLLGRGGQAEVYLGEHHYLKSFAALKVLHVLLDETHVEQFLAEAQTLVRLMHPSIVRVLDFIVEQETPVLIMDYAVEGTMRQRYPPGTCLPLATVVSVVSQLAAALQYAHSHDVIHRDVKPENILLGPQGYVLLSDFGLAVFAPSPDLLSTQAMAGTLPYTAPEQLQGHPCFASDQYALAIVTYEWLCGKRPFTGSQWQLIQQQMHAAPPPLREYNPMIPEQVEVVVLRALAKDPRERYGSVRDFAHALAHASQEALHAHMENSQETTILASQTSGETYATMASPTRTSVSPTGMREAVYDPAIPLLPATPLIGRDTEIAQLKRRLRSGGTVALTALNGLPGVGKTALAIALAHDPAIRTHFRDGILWAGLGPQPNIASMLGRWGTLLGMSSAELATLDSREIWAMALRTAIGSRCMLLIIDDAWRIDDAMTFSVGGPNCAHLITTRFPGIAAHMTVDGATTIKELGKEEGLALLRLLAPSVVDREEQRAHDLVQAVGGLPLALTLMGNYLRTQAYSGPPRRIATALERLSHTEERLHISEPHGPAQKHSNLPLGTPLSLRAVLTVTDEHLSTQARATLYALSVFPPKPNSFSEEAALAVAACMVEALDMLSDFGLLESSSEARYTLHQTVADYAGLHYHEQGAPERLIAYVITYLEAHRKDYDLLELESATILAALETARQLKKDRELVRAATAFTPFLLSRGLYSTAKQWLQLAHEVAIAQQDHRGSAGVLLYLGQIAQKQGDFAQAEIYVQDGLCLARQLGDFECMSALLTDLGGITWKRGDYAQAKMYLQDGLVLAQQMGHQERIGGIFEMLGLIATREGDYTRAEAYYQESLKFIRQVGDREQISTILHNLGVAVGEQGNYIQAEAYFQEAFILARQIGYTDLMSALLCNLGETAGGQGHYTRAESYFQEGLLLARQVGRREWISLLLLNLGLAARKQGRSAQAEEYLQESLALARQINIPQITANVLYERGNLSLEQQQVGDAEKAFEEMLAITPKGSQDLISLAQYGLARTFAVQGNIDEAQRLGTESVATLETMGHRNAREVRDWLSSLGFDRK